MKAELYLWLAIACGVLTFKITNLSWMIAGTAAAIFIHLFVNEMRKRK